MVVTLEELAREDMERIFEARIRRVRVHRKRAKSKDRYR